jgi:hypothetical protein
MIRKLRGFLKYGWTSDGLCLWGGIIRFVKRKNSTKFEIKRPGWKLNGMKSKIVAVFSISLS